MLLRNGVMVAVIIGGIGIAIGTSMISFDLAAAAKGNHDLFKNWKSLIDPLVNLQGRVSELESQVDFLEARVDELEELIDENPPQSDILVQLDEFEYDPGDDILITGVIDEDVLDPDLDWVAIAVFSPGSSFEEAADIDSEGEFEFNYELADSAGDGLYTIRIEYGGLHTFTYFIVDEEANPAEVEPEDDAYLGGQEVEMIGVIFDPQTGIDEVIITVLDPNNDDVIDEEAVALGAEDEFNFAFDLENNALLGRYAIIVEYDGEVVEEALFEVHT